MYAEQSSNATLIMLSQTVLAPLALMLLGLGLWALVGRQRLSITPFWAVAMAVAFWVSGSWIRGRIGLPPARSMDILGLLGFAGVILELVVARIGTPWRGWMAALGTVALMGWLLSAVLSRMAFTGLILTLVAIGIFFTLLYLIANLASVKPVRNLLWMLMAAGAAPVIALDGTLVLGQLSGALASAAGLVWFAGLVFPSTREGLSLLPPLLLTAILGSAYFYAGVDPLALLLVTLGPLVLALLRQLWPVKSIVWDNARTLVLGLVPVGLALWSLGPISGGY